MYKRINDKLIIVFFVVMITLPLLSINFGKGVMSTVENRWLAEFPQFFTQDGKLRVRELYRGFPDWLNDRIGFRDSFIQLNAKIKLDLLNISPSDRVAVGRDGWFFYAPDNNIDLARGTYPLS